MDSEYNSLESHLKIQKDETMKRIQLEGGLWKDIHTYDCQTNMYTICMTHSYVRIHAHACMYVCINYLYILVYFNFLYIMDEFSLIFNSINYI